MEACGHVDKALDSRSEGLEFDSQCWPCVEVSGKLFHTALLYPAVMGIWCTDPRLNQYLQAAVRPTAREGKSWTCGYLDSKQITFTFTFIVGVST